MSDWRTRLQGALDAQGPDFKITEFSTSLGFSKDFVTRLLKPDSNPGINNLQAVCDGLSISIIYLFTGENASDTHGDVARRLTNMSKAELLKLKGHLDNTDITRFVPDPVQD